MREFKLFEEHWAVIYCPRGSDVFCSDTLDFDISSTVFDSYDEALAFFFKIRELINPSFISLQYSRKRKETVNEFH